MSVGCVRAERPGPSVRGRFALMFCLALLAITERLAAGTWHREFGAAGLDAAASIALDGADGAILVGRGRHGSEYRARAFRVDAAGDLLWSRTLNVSFSTLYDVVRLSDGTFVAVGEERATLQLTSGLVVRFDANGDVLWKRSLDGAPGNVTVFSVAVTQGGDLVLAGVRSTMGVYTAFIVGLSTDGSLGWQIELDSTGTPGTPRVVATRDGGFLYVGQCRLVAGRGLDGWAVKFDPAAQLQWQAAVGMPSSSESFNSAIERPDGSFLVVGQDEGRPPEALMISLSAVGDVLTQSTFPSGLGAREIVATPDGGALIAGVSDPTRGLLIKLDPTHAVEWGVLHGTAGGGAGFDDVAIAANGEIFAVRGTWESFVESASGVLRLDASGRVPDVCWSIESALAPIPGASTRVSTSLAPSDPAMGWVADPAAAFVPDALAELTSCAPDEIKNLRAARAGDDVVLTWDPDPLAATHELHRGNVVAFDSAAYDHASIGACDLLAPSHRDAVALDGGSYYYLAIGRNAWGLSPFGFASTGAGIPVASPPCP